MTRDQLNTAQASAIDKGELPSPPTPEGDLISRGEINAALDALKVSMAEKAMAADDDPGAAVALGMASAGVDAARATLASLPASQAQGEVKTGFAAEMNARLRAEVAAIEADHGPGVMRVAADILRKVRERAKAQAAQIARGEVFATSGAEDHWIADSEAGVYDVDAPAAPAPVSADMGNPISEEVTDHKGRTPDHPDYEPGCDISGRCEVSDADQRSGTRSAMCILCGGERWRDHPHSGNWGTWDGVGPEPGSAPVSAGVESLVMAAALAEFEKWIAMMDPKSGERSRVEYNISTGLRDRVNDAMVAALRTPPPASADGEVKA